MRVFALIFPLFVSFLAAAQVSVTPPKWYQEVMEPLLSSMDQLDLEPNKAMIEDEAGVILLAETIHRVRPNGAKDTIYHYVYRPLTEKGVEQVQEERLSFSAERQKMHLIKARTISPDGKITEASKEGIFLQRPEGDRGSSIYDDREDLVVIYSDVKVGCLVEIIALREELEPRVNGETSGAMGWAPSGWPTVQRRRVVGVGPEMSKRFKIVPLGKGTPTARISQEKGLTWYDWTQKNVQSRPYEPNRPTSSQVGPATWYTTFKSWEQVGQWYGKLVEPQGLMESSLRIEVEKAVGELTKPREVLNALYPLAAKKVRYTGLEFGHSGILPYSCNEVWNRKYGDCKDKSTLLVSMLRSRGIEAWVGLVNTEGEGLIPKKAPGTRMFNHAFAIVDVDPSEKEELVFCDPTISYGTPGVISPSSADREILLASAGGGRLVRSPEATAGSYDYDFDLEMDEAGRMSGWLNWKSSGYYAISTASSYDGLDRDSTRSRVAGMVTNFFPSAEVVDFEVPEKLAPGISECVIKVFFTTAPGDYPAGANIPVNFPNSSSLFMNYGNQKTRESDYFQWQDVITVSMSLKLAKGLVPVVLHPSLHALSPGYHIDAEWDFKPTELKTSLKVQCLKPSLEPAEVLAAQQASRAWAQWSEQPLLLEAGKDWKAPAAQSEIKLPLMPTGQGQLALVRRWYPLSQESKRRKLALEKVLLLFPDDPETLYDTRLALGDIHYNAGRLKKARAAYGKLAANRPAGVSAAGHSLAHYMTGLCAFDLEDYQAAATSFAQSAAIEGAPPFRLGWGLTGQAQSLMRLGKLDQAIALFLKAEKIGSNHHSEVLGDLIHCYLRKDQVDEAVTAWERFKIALGEESMAVLGSLARCPAEPALATSDQLKKFFDVLKPKLNQDDAKALDALVSDFTYQREKLKAAAELRSKLQALLEEKFPNYLSKDLHLAIADQVTYKTKLGEFRNQDANKWLDHCYGYLSRYEVDDVFTTFFWHFILHVEWKESPLPQSQQILMKSLIPLCELIPRQDGNYWESQFIVADYYKDRGDWKEAEEILRAMPEDPLFDEEFAASAWQRRGIALENLGRWEDAVKVHLHLKDDKMEFGSVCEQLMRAGWIQARLGRPDEALETWSLLKDVPTSLYESLDDANRIEEAALLASMPEKTKAYWKHTTKWWDETLQDYLKENGLEISADPLLSDQVEMDKVIPYSSKDANDLEVEELNQLMTALLSGVRWFPSLIIAVQDLFENFVRPVTKAKNEDFRRVALALLDQVEAGSELIQIEALEQAHFYKMILKEEDAQEHGYRLLKMLDGEELDGGRQLALRRLAIVAIRDQQGLEEVEKALRNDWGLRAQEQGRFNIGVAISQVLEARGETQQAIDFAKSVLEVPAIKEDPEKVKIVARYLETLEGESKDERAFVAQLESFQKNDPVPWLAHVGPYSLDDEGFEDPAEYLAGTGKQRHLTEDYKWGCLLLKSNLITQDQRMQVFDKLAEFHLSRCLKKSEYQNVSEDVLANEDLPQSLRVSRLWKSAVQASLIQVDEEWLNKLAKDPLRKDLRDDLKDRGFQDLFTVVRARKGSKEEHLAGIKEIVARGELTAISSGCVANLIAATPAFLDEEFTAEVEAFFKTITLDGRTSRQMRQEAIRLRKTSAEMREEFQFVTILKPAFRERIAELAKQAPTDWDDFRNYNEQLKLPSKSEIGVYAKLILDGPPLDSLQIRVWEMLVPHLFVRDGKTLDAEALKLFLSSLDQIESEETVSLILGTAFAVSQFSDDLGKEILRQCQPWITAKKDRDLEDAHTIRKFVVGLSVPSEEELVRLARKVGRLDNAGSFRSCVNLFQMLLDREKKEPLEELLQMLPENALYSQPFVNFALQGFQQLGESDEVELLEEELLEGQSIDWKDAWSKRNIYDYQHAVAAYWLVTRKKGEPIPVWLKGTPKTIVLKVERVRCELLLLMTLRKWQEFDDLLKKNLDLLEDAEGRVLQACGDLGLEKEGARERARKVLLSPDKRDSYAIQLRELLKGL